MQRDELPGVNVKFGTKQYHKATAPTPPPVDDIIETSTVLLDLWNTSKSLDGLWNNCLRGKLLSFMSFVIEGFEIRDVSDLKTIQVVVVESSVMLHKPPNIVYVLCHFRRQWAPLQAIECIFELLQRGSSKKHGIATLPVKWAVISSPAICQLGLRDAAPFANAGPLIQRI